MAAKKKRSKGSKASSASAGPPIRPATSSPLPAARPAQPASAGSPAGLAGIVGIGVGLLLFVHGVTTAFGSGLDRVSYWLGVLCVGPVLVLSSWLMLRGLRVGWAFFVGITGPAALATFFGAPTIRKAVTASMSEGSSATLHWLLALVPMLVFSAMCVLASVDHARFEDSE